MKKAIIPIEEMSLIQLAEMTTDELLSYRESVRKGVSSIYNSFNPVLYSDTPKDTRQDAVTTIGDNIEKYERLISMVNDECDSRGIAKSLESPWRADMIAELTVLKSEELLLVKQVVGKLK